MNKIIIAFLLIFSYKLISNIMYLIRIMYYYSLYSDFLKNKSTKIFQHKNHVIDLFKQANISNASYPVSQNSGCNIVSSGYTSIFSSFPTKDFRILKPTEATFQNAIGIFKGRIFECFSPKYWIDCIIFLPRNILIYLNISAESIFIRICQIIYWLIGVILTLFSTDISNWLKSFIVR